MKPIFVLLAAEQACPQDAKIPMSGFAEGFFAVVKFEDAVWVINDQKVMAKLKGQL